MTYEFTGTVAAIKPIQTFKSGFQKQEVVLEDDDPERANQIAFQFLKHKLPLVSKIREGDRVTFVFSLGGHEWNGRHFVELLAHDIYREAAQAPQTIHAPVVDATGKLVGTATAVVPPKEDPNDPTTWRNQQPADEQEELPF